MPKQIRVLEQTFFSQMRNGEDFTLNPADHTDFLAASIGERIKAVSVIDVAWYTEASSSNPVAVSDDTIERTTGSWTDDGFAVGDTVLIDFFSSPDQTKIILYVDDLTMIFTTGTGIFSAASTVTVFYGITPMEAILFDYGLVENGGPTQFTSKINNYAQSYDADGIVSAAPALVTLDEKDDSINRVWQNGKVEAKFLGLSPDGRTQFFQIEHEFIVLPYFIDGYLSNLQNGTLPLLFASGNTLKYVIRANFRDFVINPNSNKEVVLDDRLGTVGFYNQNFNGFNVEYSIDSIDYGAFDGLAVGATTNVTIVVNSAGAVFGAGDPVLVGLSYLPESVDYVDLETYEQNFLYDLKRQLIGDPAVASSIISNLVITLNSASKITITFDTDYTGAQQLKLDENKYFAIWVEVGDASLSNATDDRVALLADVEQYDFDPDVAGLITADPRESLFFFHCQDPDFSAGSNDFKGWIEDGLLWKFKAITAMSLNAVIEAASFKFAAYNPTTGDFFILQEYNFDLSASVLLPFTRLLFPLTILQEQQIAIDSSRGFILGTGDPFNFVKWETPPPTPLVDDTQVHNIQVAFKMNWEEWINNPNVNVVFYDVAEPNNGFNQRSDRYSLKEGYEIVGALDFTMSNGVSLTEYRFISAPANVQDYHINDTEDPETYCCVVTTHDQADTTNLNSGYLSTENTLIRARFSRCDLGDLDVEPATICGIIRLDINNGGLFSIHELSTFRDPETGSPLKPVAGETHTKIFHDPADKFIDLLCEVDFTQLTPGETKCTTGRIWFELKTEGFQDEGGESFFAEVPAGNPEELLLPE